MRSGRMSVTDAHRCPFVLMMNAVICLSSASVIARAGPACDVENTAIAANTLNFIASPFCINEIGVTQKRLMLACERPVHFNDRAINGSKRQKVPNESLSLKNVGASMLGQREFLVTTALCLLIPMKPPLCSEMIAPRDSGMISPPSEEVCRQVLLSIR